ncbi:transposase [Candidatus Dependentiae bacterium]|nr:transposase [Candidatus Dependentiae bacterium]
MKLNRRSIRLKGFDYSISWVYSITIFTFDKKCTLGRIKGNKMYKNLFGKIVKEELINSNNIRKEIEIYEYSIMPNHLHFIVFIYNKYLKFQNNSDVRSETPTTCFKPHSLGVFINNFKGMVTKRIREIIKDNNLNFWQRNYYDHLIRNEEDYIHCVNYIRDNPKNWNDDDYNPEV